MTTLILAQRKIVSFFPAVNLSVEARFRRFNSKGKATFTLLGILLVSVIAYLAALYITFNLSFHIRENNEKLTKLEDTALALELKFQEESAGLVKNKGAFLETMEEVSSIKYLSSDGSSVSYR